MGDGKETCHNPDHGFIYALTFTDIERLGCPVCGHDEDHKVINGGDCETCKGKGEVGKKVAVTFLNEMDYDVNVEELKLLDK